MTTIAPSTSDDEAKLPQPNEEQAENGEFHDSRRSVAKEQWRNLLEQFVQHQEDQEFPDDQELPDGLQQPSFVRSDSDLSIENAGGQHRSSIITATGTVTGAATVATEQTGTAAELNEMNRDLEDTADNLADLEIEFEAELQAISMGISSAFEQWNSSEHDMMTAASLQGFAPGQQLLTDESIRSEFGTSMRSDIGTSIRSIRQHTRHLNYIKKDMENTFRENVKKQETMRRKSVAGDSQIVAFEEDMVVDAKFNNWFGKVWSVIEELLARRRARREAAQIAAQKAREAAMADRTRVKSFWQLFYEF